MPPSQSLASLARVGKDPRRALPASIDNTGLGVSVTAASCIRRFSQAIRKPVKSPQATVSERGQLVLGCTPEVQRGVVLAMGAIGGGSAPAKEKTKAPEHGSVHPLATASVLLRSGAIPDTAQGTWPYALSVPQVLPEPPTALLKPRQQ